MSRSKSTLMCCLLMDCNGEVQCYINGVADQSINKHLMDCKHSLGTSVCFYNELLRTSFVQLFDVICSFHVLEHVKSPNKFLEASLKVLKDDGMAIIKCPDIQSVCEAVAKGKLLEPFYNSPVGPISPIDILFGNRQQIMKGNEYMAKKVGFTYSVLNKTFAEAGFQARYGGRMPANGGELAIVAFKQKKSEEQIKQIADPLIF